MSDRAQAQCVMASADFRRLSAIEDKVRFLGSHSFPYGVIAAATGVHLSRVKRYLGDRAATSTRGRRPEAALER